MTIFHNPFPQQPAVAPLVLTWGDDLLVQFDLLDVDLREYTFTSACRRDPDNEDTEVWNASSEGESPQITVTYDEEYGVTAVTLQVDASALADIPPGTRSMGTEYVLRGTSPDGVTRTYVRGPVTVAPSPFYTEEEP